MLICSTLALASSCYLAWASFTSSSVAGCGQVSVFDCDHVLHSRWASVLSVPVSVPAIAMHALVIVMLLSRPANPQLERWRWSAVGFAAFAAGSAALWFVGLQVFWLQHLCPYCLVAHTGGLILAIVFLSQRPLTRGRISMVALVAIASTLGLITTQVMATPPPTYEVIQHSAMPATTGDDTFDFAAPGHGSIDASSGSQTPAGSDIFEAPGTFEAPAEETPSVEASGEPTGEREAPVFEAPVTEPAPVPNTAADLSAMLNGLESAISSGGRLVAATMHPALLLSGEVEAGEVEAGESAPQRRMVRVLNQIQLATSDWPLVGNPDAEMVFVELFDYTCPHCQRTHKSLEGARRTFGDRLAIMTLPLPLDAQCNPTVRSTAAKHREACEIAKLAIAVWRVDRSQFEPFHNYLFDSKAGYAQARRHAATLVDEAKLVETLNSSLPGEYISKHVTLYQKAGSGTIPKLMFPKTTTVGAVESTDAMVRLINQNLTP
ncbi:thioredoxin domain-containing protein [Roseiconus nitratireducens]|uniref:Thioredoxin domain-containing protein n=2 Tax=Roseiconus nitratireducens TaxID=2605748 RepID=A0A5M6DCA8_9BACT|nr:thioredoxin domain-containing protein [Roseiconus nitratireducens]